MASLKPGVYQFEGCTINSNDHNKTPVTTSLELFKDGTVTGKSGFTAGSKHSNYAGQTGTSEGKWEGDTITITEVANSVKGLSAATTKTVYEGRFDLATGVYSGSYLWYGFGRTSPGTFKFTLTTPRTDGGAPRDDESKAAAAAEDGGTPLEPGLYDFDGCTINSYDHNKTPGSISLELFKDGTVKGMSSWSAGTMHSNYAGQVGVSDGTWDGDAVVITDVANSLSFDGSSSPTKTVYTGRLDLATGVYSGTYLWYGYGRTSPGEFKFTLTNPKAAAGADTEEEVKAATPEDHDHGPEDATDAAAGEGGKAVDGDDVADAEPEPRTTATTFEDELNAACTPDEVVAVLTATTETACSAGVGAVPSRLQIAHACKNRRTKGADVWTQEVASACGKLLRVLAEGGSTMY